MTRAFAPNLIAAALAATLTTAKAVPADDVVGPYVGASAGVSSFSLRDVSVPQVSIDDRDRSFKLYGGYQLGEHFGVEAGYVSLGDLEAGFDVGGTTVGQTVSARSIYLAGTGRLPLGESFALTAKGGVSFGKVSGTHALPAADSLTGSKTSVFLGFGTEIRVNRDLAFTLDYEAFGELSPKLSASTLTAGVRLSF